MPFRSGSLTYQLSVPVRGGGSVRVSTGTRSLALARRMEQAVRAIGARGAHDWPLLAAITDGTIPVGDFYDAYERRDLGALHARLHDIDLEPSVARWHRACLNRSAGQYLRTVRILIPEGAPFRRSQFTRDAVKRHLEQWAVGSTRNAYRYALSSLADWLVEAGVLEQNPVRQVKRAKEPPPRVVYYSDAESQAVVSHLSPAQQAMEAFMGSTSAEWCACRALRRLDINPETRVVQAHGTKTPRRDRPVVFTQDWAWRLFWGYARAFTPQAHLFTMHYQTALYAHHRATRLAQVEDSTMHDWRHSFAVRLRRAGEPDWKIAALMGHTDTTQVAKIYGKFTPDESELQVRQHG